MAPSKPPIRLLIYGGNGYVGSKVLEMATGLGAQCTSVSRSGKIPVHLSRSRPSWLEQVHWIAGDACQPDPALIASATAIICLVGSPPVPTFSQKAFDRQVMMNGTANSAVIAEALRQGVQRVVLLSAHIPPLMRSSRFGYYVGKQQAVDAVRDYTDASDENTATVIYPSAIYGTRHTPGGTAIPLGILMAPVAWLLRRLPAGMARFLPESPVSLQQVASATVNAAFEQENRGLVTLENRDLVKQQPD
jgi:nucleoside-diphosphate-sugar epimerase